MPPQNANPFQNTNKIMLLLCYSTRLTIFKYRFSLFASKVHLICFDQKKLVNTSIFQALNDNKHETVFIYTSFLVCLHSLKMQSKAEVADFFSAPADPRASNIPAKKKKKFASMRLHIRPKSSRHRPSACLLLFLSQLLQL
jgi:hypothetical protein